MALITTLIPAYRMDYLDEVFIALQRQSFKDFRVLISDDSPGDTVSAQLQTPPWQALMQGLDVSLMRGPKSISKNHQALLDAWAGSTPLVHFLMDDDAIYPDFYQAHVQAHQALQPSFTVSHRWLSVNDLRPAYKLPLPDWLETHPQHLVTVDAPTLFESTVAQHTNWVGELCHMVVARDAALRYPRPPVDDLNHYGLTDMAMMLEAVALRPFVVIRNYLGVFRQHGGQDTQRTMQLSGKIARMVWTMMALRAWRDGRLTEGQTVQAVYTCTERLIKELPATDVTLQAYLAALNEATHGMEALYAAMCRFWLKLLDEAPGVR